MKFTMRDKVYVPIQYEGRVIYEEGEIIGAQSDNLKSGIVYSVFVNIAGKMERVNIIEDKLISKKAHIRQQRIEQLLFNMYEYIDNETSENI